MKIKINGNCMQIEDHCRLEEVLINLSLSNKKGMAVAVNTKVVSKNKWVEYYLKENDELIIIEAAQGG
jgi:sulfur carrier protein